MSAARGWSLIELMVALVLGCSIVAAALALYDHSRAAARANESVARLQEEGRYALSVIEADVEHAGFYGFTNLPETLRLIAGGQIDSPLADAFQMRQSMPAVAGLPASVHACGANYALDLLMPVQGSDGAFDLACAPYGSGAQQGADTLTLHRAETREAVPEPGRLQIFAPRLRSRTAHFLLADGDVPGPIDADHRLLNLVVRTYYIARDSVSRAGFPALRVKSLGTSRGRISFDEDEVIAGVEDLQVQFGIDTGGAAHDGASATAQGMTQYVSADFPGLADCRVGAVRLWLRLRAQEPEHGFADDRTYRYADIVYTPAGAEREYRRALMSRTIAVRNARLY